MCAPVDQAVQSDIPTDCIWSETIGTSPGQQGRERMGMVGKEWKGVERENLIITTLRAHCLVTNKEGSRLDAANWHSWHCMLWHSMCCDSVGCPTQCSCHWYWACKTNDHTSRWKIPVPHGVWRTAGKHTYKVAASAAARVLHQGPSQSLGLGPILLVALGTHHKKNTQTSQSTQGSKEERHLKAGKRLSCSVKFICWQG